MGADVLTQAHVDYAGFVNLVGIIENIFDCIGNVGVVGLEADKYNIGIWCHAVIFGFHVATCGNAHCVCTVILA